MPRTFTTVHVIRVQHHAHKKWQEIKANHPCLYACAWKSFSWWSNKVLIDVQQVTHRARKRKAKSENAYNEHFALNHSNHEYQYSARSTYCGMYLHILYMYM